jgi:hypothetical protein
MRVGRRAAAFFPLAASYRFCGDQGPSRGVGGAQRGLRHEGDGAGRCERGRGPEEARELLEKRRRTSASLYLAKDRGWQMRSGPTPYRTRRAVRAVTGPLNRTA